MIGLVALIELSPRLSATQEPPFLSGDQIPSVMITNDGYLKVTDVRVICFLFDVNIAGNSFGFMMAGNGSPAQNILEPTVSYTVSCSPGTFIRAPTQAINHVEAGIVTYYRPWPFTVLRSRKFFRFVAHNNGTTLNWFKEPPNDTMEQRFAQFVAENGAPK